MYPLTGCKITALKDWAEAGWRERIIRKRRGRKKS
jgi:hypothetical protein